ncbi:MAG: hypothetical protein JSW47_18760 [Phycisphaerales bacterium]|nr:MAG: hypothetical protein JSW47_18760 [Phycisphaerales bacterium]UCF17597.1 MAG: hypothetical protein JSW59_09075 [Phycisphaerales bacterium]
MNSKLKTRHPTLETAYEFICACAAQQAFFGGDYEIASRDKTQHEKACP